MKSPAARALLLGLVLLLLIVFYRSVQLSPTTNHLSHGSTSSSFASNTAADSVLPAARGFRGRGRDGSNRSYSHDNNYNNNKSGSPRIAILLPYAAKGLAAVLPYLLVFCQGAQGAADIADFLIIHNGVLSKWPRLQQQCPPNVIFINLESNVGMARRLLRVLDDPPPGDDTASSSHHKTVERDAEEQQELVNLVASFIKINPYGLVEFKPALGHIFADYLEGYSHWGYSDLDIMFGDLGRWIDPDELTEYDIVTFGYGDQQRLYLRGQFTFHKNDPVRINQLWRGCKYLTHLDDRFEQILLQKKHYRTESAEGCYSTVILDRTDLKVKYAVKAWTDTRDSGGQETSQGSPSRKLENTFASHGVYLTTNRMTDRQVLYKDTATNDHKTEIPNWFEVDNHSIYGQRDYPLQRPMGAMEHVEWKPHPAGDKCMYWVMANYQSKICIGTPIGEGENVFWIDGQLYKQRFEAAANWVDLTGPFFHFQEWKRRYRFGQLAAMHPMSKVSTFLLGETGAIPISDGFSTVVDTSSKKAVTEIRSPLGLNMKQWHGIQNDDRSQLPGDVYCVFSKLDRTKTKTDCDVATMWTDVNVTDILATAPGWRYVDTELDVTLVLTLQITVAQSNDSETLKAIIDHLSNNIERWYGQPCVVMIFMAGATETSALYLMNRLGPGSSFAERNSNVLIAAVYEQSNLVVSRKALLNMVTDAVPTRWYITGLELERGLVMSNDARFFATRMAITHNPNRGNVFWIPQFGIPTDSDFGDIDQFLDAKQKGEARFLSEFEGKRCVEDSTRIFKSLDAAWWKQTLALLQPQEQDSFSRQAEELQRFDTRLLEVLEDLLDGSEDPIAEEESPILLIDNAGPYDGIWTSEMVREVEELGGMTCYNVLKTAQLAALGYRFNVLPGVFALSSDATRKVFGVGNGNALRCEGCSASDHTMDDVLHLIAKDEILRVADTSILWMELESPS